MNLFKRKRELRRLQNLPELTRFEVCDKLQSLTVQFGLTFTENEICFPQPMCCQQYAIYLSACCEELYEKSICFSDIIYINKNSKRVCMALRTGHVFYFFYDSELWYIYNPLHYGEPSYLFLLWWWYTGRILFWWRKLFPGNYSL